jgi:hypothetical protein
MDFLSVWSVRSTISQNAIIRIISACGIFDMCYFMLAGHILIDKCSVLPLDTSECRNYLLAGSDVHL